MFAQKSLIKHTCQGFDLINPNQVGLFESSFFLEQLIKYQSNFTQLLNELFRVGRN